MLQIIQLLLRVQDFNNCLEVQSSAKEKAQSDGEEHEVT